LLLNGIETATVNHPQLRGCFAGGCRLLNFSELAVEPREVVRLADPHDACKNVEPSDDEI
jgi:hypothetical protein